MHRGICTSRDVSKFAIPQVTLTDNDFYVPYLLQLVREGPTYSSRACPNLLLTFQLQPLCLSGISSILPTSGRMFSILTRLVMPGAAEMFPHRCQRFHHLSEQSYVSSLLDRSDEGPCICW